MWKAHREYGHGRQHGVEGLDIGACMSMCACACTYLEPEVVGLPDDGVAGLQRVRVLPDDLKHALPRRVCPEGGRRIGSEEIGGTRGLTGQGKD